MFDSASVARETISSYRLGGDDDWARPDRELRRLAKERAAHDYDETKWILAALRAKTHKRLGFASFSEYLGRLFGWSPRLIQDKVRVAEALEALPEVARALNDGAINWSAVRELTRVATVETEREWLDASRGRSIREVERMVSGRAPGDRPRDRARPEITNQVIRAEVSPETMALWREAMMAVQKEAGGSLSEDETIRMIARIALGGPESEGRAAYQIVISRCPDCQRTTQRGRGEEIDVAQHVLEAAECDAQRLDLRSPERTLTSLTTEGGTEGARRTLATAAASGGSSPPGDEGHGRVRAMAPRASQEIPPAVRRFVLHRDHGRCVVNGCRHAAFVDLHHLKLRSEGGTHDPDLLVTLCGAHHAQAHEGRLLIDGTASSGLTFRHADGSPYGERVMPELAGILSDTFDALVHLDFKQCEARRAVDELRAHVGAGGTLDTVPAALKMALRFLVPR